MPRLGARLDQNARANLAGALPLAEAAFAGCMVPVAALQRASATEIIGTAAAPRRA